LDANSNAVAGASNPNRSPPSIATPAPETAAPASAKSVRTSTTPPRVFAYIMDGVLAANEIGVVGIFI